MKKIKEDELKSILLVIVIIFLGLLVYQNNQIIKKLDNINTTISDTSLEIVKDITGNTRARGFGSSRNTTLEDIKRAIDNLK